MSENELVSMPEEQHPRRWSRVAASFRAYADYLHGLLLALAQWLRSFASLIAGIVVGIGITILVLNAGRDFWEGSVWIGVIAGVTAFVLFVLIRVLLTNSLTSISERAAGSDGFGHFIARIASAFFPGDSEKKQLIDEIAAAAPRLANSAFAFLSAVLAASAAVGLAVAIAGTVVSMATVVATFHQVDRMDRQNKLIEQQIAEATATRVSSLFAAQLPALLSEIDRSRPSDSSKEWVIDPALVARIQALIYATQPYAVDNQFEALKLSVANAATADPSNQELKLCSRLLVGAEDRPRTFSPERGQLLTLLIAAGFPFARLPDPLDFSGSDLRNLRLRRGGFGPLPLVDLGETILRGANLRDADLSNLDLSRSDLSETLLPDLSRLDASTRFIAMPSVFQNDTRHLRWLMGAKLDRAVVDLLGQGGSRRLRAAEGYRERVWIPGKLALSGSGTKRTDEVYFKDLLPLRLCKGLALIGSPTGLDAIVRVLRDLIPAGTSAAMSRPLRCDPGEIPSLLEMRRRLRIGPTSPWPQQADDPLLRYTWIVLKDLHPDLADCVFREGAFKNAP